MEKVLSQEEINALFSAMSSEDLGLGKQPERTGSTRQVASYDFHRVDRIPQDQMRSIHLLHEHFGRNFASSLSAYLRTIAELNVVSLEQESYSAFIKSLPDPTLFASIGMRPLDANMALELNPSLVFPMIDMILGGPGHPLSENRNLTEIEMNIIDGVIKLALKDLGAAWRAIMEFDFYLEGKGTKPQVFQILSHGETVIAVQMNMKIGDGSGTMNFCIPANVLKMLRGKFDQQWSVRRQKSPGNESERLLELMQPVPLLLSGELRRSTLTLDDLLKITAGDIIELNERIGDPIFLCVGGKEKFIGRIVQRRGKKAFEISDRYAG